MVHKGDFLLTNSMSFGRPYITNVDGCIHDGWLVISPIANSYYQDFLYFLLSSAFAYSQFADKVSGAVVKNLNSDKVSEALFPLPPTSEQYRICSKLDALIGLSSKYQAFSEDLKTLDSSLLGKIKKSILQEAIQGKLVPQIASEGTAESLLEEIRIEKERLIKEKKIKRDKLDSVIFKGDDNKYYEKVGKDVVDITEEIPFEIPSTWCWCRGKTIFLPMQSTKPASDFIYIDVDAVNNKTNTIDNPKNIQLKAVPSRATRKLECNNVLFSMVRPYLRNIAIVNEQYSNAIASTGFYVIRPTVALYPQYLFRLMLSSYVVDGLNKFMKGENSPSINNNHIEDYLYPLPPINEQKRIIEQLDLLFQQLR
jgi:type I restriction enzyme S subunit